MNVQIIEKDGNPEYAIIPYSEYLALVSAAEDAADVAEFDRVKKTMAGEETIPAEVVKRLIDGENPVKVWRNHRELTLQVLAEKVGVTKGYLSQVENGSKTGTVDLFIGIAKALDVTIEELVGWRQ